MTQNATFHAHTDYSSLSSTFLKGGEGVLYGHVDTYGMEDGPGHSWVLSKHIQWTSWAHVASLIHTISSQHASPIRLLSPVEINPFKLLLAKWPHHAQGLATIIVRSSERGRINDDNDDEGHGLQENRDRHC
jgi:hypothetical protein